jgi:hypothetical protein
MRFGDKSRKMGRQLPVRDVGNDIRLDPKIESHGGCPASQRAFISQERVLRIYPLGVLRILVHGMMTCSLEQKTMELTEGDRA